MHVFTIQISQRQLKSTPAIKIPWYISKERENTIHGEFQKDKCRTKCKIVGRFWQSNKCEKNCGKMLVCINVVCSFD